MRWLVAVLLLAGCTAPVHDPCPGVTLDDGLQTLCADGVARTLRVHVPDSPDGTLIIALHGGGSWAARMADQARFHEAAPNALVVYPDGVGLGESGLLRTWNAMHCCGIAFQEDVDDVAFLAAIIQRMEQLAGEQRVLVVGHSNGAMMAYRFAAEQPGHIDGVAAVAGSIGGVARPGVPDVRPPIPDEPVPVIIVHGLHDEQVPYAGGAGNDTVGPRMDASVAEAVAFWRQANGATILSSQHDGDVLIEMYTGEAGVTVVTTPGGHAWPTQASAGIDGTQRIVDWFYDL